MLQCLYMNPIQSILTQFSFTEQESEVYIACLTLGPAKLTDIALKIDKNRTAVYFHVKNLVKKGFLKEGKKGRVLRFTPVAPSDISEKFERLTNDFKSYVPQLEALNRIDTDTPIITVQESRIGYRKIYEELASLPPKSMFRALEGKKAIESELQLLTQDEFYAFFSRVAARDIETKGLFTREALLVPNRMLTKKNYAEIKKRIWHIRSTTEENLPFQDLIFIYENKVALMFPESSLVVTIKHRGIADAMTVLFDALYLFANPEKTPW
jgi:predicted transcriptional regulator